MKSKLTVLVVEDSNDDFELIRYEMLKWAQEIRWVRADSEQTLRKALEQNLFDLVLSDYSLRGFTAIDVLRILKAAHPDVPCIIVSGTIGEDTAVAVIKAGAKDYVQKDRLFRLAPVLDRELARHEAERAQILLSRAVHDALWDWDLATDEVQWNEGLKELFGYDVEGRKTTAEWGRERIHPDDVIRVLAAVQTTLKENRENWVCEYRLQKADGQYAYVLDRAYIVRNATGRMIRVVGAIIDITPQKHAELRTLASAQQLKQAQSVARMGSFEFDVNTMLFSASEEFYRICELPSDTLIDLEIRKRIVHPEDQDRVLRVVGEAFANSKPYELDYRLSVPSGIKHVHARAEPMIEADGAVNHFVGIIQDFSDRIHSEELLRKNEEQLRQLQKMESIGRLAGGIAHDYNNMLAAIQMYCELAKDEATPNVKESLDQIKSIVDRGASLTRQLLLFSRKQPRFKKKITLNQSIGHIEKMLRRLIGETISLETECEPDLWPIYADPGQVDQVLVNLAVNARDAMTSGGKIRICTRNVELAAEDASKFGLNPGRYAFLSMKDTGSGIPPEVLQKIFEPFFTTKPMGQGTGLGLSIVYGILKEHEGAIDVSSEVGKGSTFCLYFPASDSSWTDEIETMARPPLQPATGTWVLLVEDEPDLRHSFAKILEQRGFQVLAAQNGQEAFEIFKQRPDDVRLVITDMTMPILGGKELMEKIHASHPQIPAIFMSGYTENYDQMPNQTGSAPLRFLSKPFSGALLDQMIREVLGKK